MNTKTLLKIRLIEEEILTANPSRVAKLVSKLVRLKLKK
jgi:hypothetical protein